MESSPEAAGSAEPAIKRAFTELDRLLRGEVTRTSSLAARGNRRRSRAALAGRDRAEHGLRGLHGDVRPLLGPGPNAMQVLASMVKVPALFFLTLLVTLPSLYVFNALVGSRLTLAAVVRLLVATLGVIVAVLASLGPIVAFFSVSTTSYPFILLFNVVDLRRLRVPGDALPAPDPAPAERGRGRLSAPDVAAASPDEPVSRACRRSRPRRRPGAEPAREDDLPALDDRVRPGGSPDGLGLATVRGQSRTCHSPGSAAGSRTSSRPCSTRS